MSTADILKTGIAECVCLAGFQLPFSRLKVNTAASECEWGLLDDHAYGNEASVSRYVMRL